MVIRDNGGVGGGGSGGGSGSGAGKMAESGVD